jgi:hypothetical protein
MITITTLQRLEALDELDIILNKKFVDRHDPLVAERELRASLYDAWQSQLQIAAHQAAKFVRTQIFYKPQISDVASILQIFSDKLNRNTLSPLIYTKAKDAIAGGYDRAKQEVDEEFKRQTGMQPAQKDDRITPVGFGMLFGVTEQHSIEALAQQAIVSAGGFWNKELSDSIKTEMEKWYQDANFSTSDLVEKMSTMVNERLSVEGKNSLPRSYFDGLAEHIVVRNRTVAKVARGAQLGATHYRLYNPRDTRTSSVCMALSKPGKTWTVAAAQTSVQAIQTAGTLDDLKVIYPFWKSPDEDRPPVPPLHWRCRSMLQMVFTS